MSGFDYDAVQAAQEELNSRGGSKLFIRLDKDNLAKDIRILEPTPSMLGKYWVEVPIWWVNGKPITSPEIIGESDVVQEILDDFEKDFKNQKAEDQFKKFRDASKGQGLKLVKRIIAYWLPVLEFDWRIEAGSLVGIYDDKNEYDVTKIKHFIKDEKAKILDAKVTLLKGINNQILTGRDGKNFLSQENGYNMTIQRTGKDRDTVYTATKQEQMPMPEDFYGAGALDVLEVAKAGLYTETYIEQVLAQYFYGEALPENPEYRFPELRDKFKDSEEKATTHVSRRRTAETQAEPEVVKPAPEPQAEVTPVGRATRTAAAPVGRARRSDRSLLKDATNA